MRLNVVTTCDRFPDDAGPRAQPGECLDNERKAVGQVIAWTAVEPHPIAILAGDLKPSHLISCSHSAPEGGCGAFVGRHGAMKPAGRACGRNIMVRQVAGGRRAESSRNLLRPTLVALADNGGGPLSRSPP